MAVGVVRDQDSANRRGAFQLAGQVHRVAHRGDLAHGADRADYDDRIMTDSDTWRPSQHRPLIAIDIGAHV